MCMTFGGLGLNTLGDGPLGLVWQAIANLFEGPRQSIGIEIETKKKVASYDGKNMVASKTLAVGMMETKFDNGVSTTKPGERNRNFVKNHIAGFGYSLDHTSTI